MSTKTVSISIPGVSNADVLSISINASRSGGTMTFVTTAGSSLAPKMVISVQGIYGKVERITPSINFGEKVYKVECRVTPPASNGYAFIDKVDLQDGTAYKLADLVSIVAGQAGAVVDFAGIDTDVQSMQQSGRIDSVLSNMAQVGCAKLLFDGNRFLIAQETTTNGGTISVAEEDIISISQSMQGDIIEEIATLVENLVDSMIGADSIADEIKRLEGELARNNKVDPDEKEVAEDQDDYTALGDISVSFGWWPPGVGFKPLDSIIEMDVNQSQTQSNNKWDYWIPGGNKQINPDKPSRKYYRVMEELTAGGDWTGRLMGIWDLRMATLLYPFNPPENSSGQYWARGNSMNMSGLPSWESQWERLTNVTRQSVVTNDDGTISYVTKHYFAFSVDVPLKINGDLVPAYDPDIHHIGHVSQAKLRYAPARISGWKFHGGLSYKMWTLKRSGKASVYGTTTTTDVVIGAIDIAGNIYGLDGKPMYSITDLADIPGGATIGGSAITSSEGSIVGEFANTAFYSLTGEYCGSTEYIATGGGYYTKNIASYSGGPVMGYINFPPYGTPETVAYPGINGPPPKVTRTDGEEVNRPDITVAFSTDLPSSKGVDYTGFDPLDPDAWVPVLKSPEDEYTLSEDDKKRIGYRIEEKKLDAKIIATKIQCIKTRLGTLQASGTIASVQIMYDAKKEFLDELKRQEELGIIDLTILTPLLTSYEDTFSGFANSLGKATNNMLITDCTYIYSGKIPMPGSSFTLPEVTNSEGMYDTDGGIIENVSVTINSSTCSVSVTGHRYRNGY